MDEVLTDGLPGVPGQFPDEVDPDRPASQLPGEFAGEAAEGEVLQPSAASAVPVSTAPAKKLSKAAEEDKLSPENAQNLLDLLLSPDGPPAFPTQEFQITRPDGSFNVKVKLRGLSEQEMDRIGDRSWRDATPREKKAGAGAQVRDTARMMRLTVAEAMVEPNLGDSRVLANYGPTVEDVIQRWFLPGEVDKMGDQVNDLSGWGEEALKRIQG